MRKPWLIALMLLSISAVACQRSAADPPQGVVLVLVDALRADHLGCYGYERPTSPHVDALAADATRFANAVSSTPWTLPSMATVMTSLYPSVHGATAASDMGTWLHDREHFRPVSVLADSRTTLAEVLHAHGFQTAAFVNGSYPSKVFGFSQGFDHFVSDTLPGIRLNIDALLEWLDKKRPQRFFVYLHTVEVHSPYTPPQVPDNLPAPNPHDLRVQLTRYFAAVKKEEAARYHEFDFDAGYRGWIDGSWRTLGILEQSGKRPPPRDVEHLVALYDRGIAYTDYWIGKLIDGLKQRGLYDHVLFIVTADHGDEFYDHGGLEHSKTFYEEMMHVPLIMRLPNVGHGRVVEQQVGLIDFMPTVLDLLHVPYGGTMEGRSFAPLFEGGTLPDRPIFGEASFTRGLRAVRTNQWKYMNYGAGKPDRLFDLRQDPRETKDLCAQERQRCDSFDQQLQQWERRVTTDAAELRLPTPERAVIDAQTRERLRALGYGE